MQSISKWCRREKQEMTIIPSGDIKKMHFMHAQCPVAVKICVCCKSSIHQPDGTGITGSWAMLLMAHI